MVRTKFALLLYLHMVDHNAACHTLSRFSFFLNRRRHSTDSAMLEVFFTQDSKVEDLFCGAPSSSEPSLFFSNYLFSLGFKPV